jgi:antirestriction protein ArdC
MPNIDKFSSSETLKTALLQPNTQKEEGEMDRQSIYETVTNRIVAELEKGTAPWVKPWSSGVAGGLPYNAVSQKPYSGINVMVLWLEGADRGYKQSSWLTFRQARELGGHVRKGEKGIQIVYASKFRKKLEDPETGEEKEEERHFLKGYYVFNIEQTEGLPKHLYRQIEPKPLENRVDEVETFIARLGADVRHRGGRAYYNAMHDYISLPEPGDFRSASDYYSTSLHEHAHWSGHPSRLKRDLSGSFGSEAYGQEELVAEIAGAFLCARLGVPGKLQHAEYIGAWLKILKEDKKAIFTAARKATEAADFLQALADGEGAASTADDPA